MSHPAAISPIPTRGGQPPHPRDIFCKDEGKHAMSPRDEIPRLNGQDGEGSVQVHLDPRAEDRRRHGVFHIRQGRDRQIDHLL